MAVTRGTERPISYSSGTTTLKADIPVMEGTAIGEHKTVIAPVAQTSKISGVTMTDAVYLGQGVDVISTSGARVKLQVATGQVATKDLYAILDATEFALGRVKAATLAQAVTATATVIGKFTESGVALDFVEVELMLQATV